MYISVNRECVKSSLHLWLMHRLMPNQVRSTLEPIVRRSVSCKEPYLATSSKGSRVEIEVIPIGFHCTTHAHVLSISSDISAD
jgi:hypothetical protein